MPFGELRSASGSGCSRCARRWKQRQVQALRCLCLLGSLGMFLLALPLLYLLGAKVARKPEETLVEKVPAALKQHGNPLCKDCDPTIRPSAYARVNSNVSQSKCLHGIWNSSSLLWDIEFEEGHFKLDEENVSLVIPQDGRYFVYSQVTFSCFRCSCEKDRCCGMTSRSGKKVWQAVEYKTSAYEDHKWTIFISTSPMDANLIKSIYLGGIRFFYKGDRVMVTVSHPGLVEPDEFYTFFGAYLVS